MLTRGDNLMRQTLIRSAIPKATAFWLVVLLLLGTVASLYGQSLNAINTISNPAVALDPANGNGVMIAGELWDSFAPPNKGPYYREATFPLKSQLLRMGNFDRLWTTPTMMWPGGWTNGNFWAKNMWFTEYNPDPTFNPATVAGAANPAYKASSGANYAFGAFKSTLLGANDPLRNYAVETKWVDANRQRALYEAGWPTNIGVDVKVKIHQFSLNWNNFNDFIIVEITLKNTGVLDINGDGVAEKTNNKINALTFVAHGELMCSHVISTAGGRGNRFGAGRNIGYVGDNDPKGNPYDMMIGYPGESVLGLKDMGLNDFPLRFHTDVWSGWSWLDVKKADGSAKNTIFGTHPIGIGAQRGWFTSGGQGRGLSVNDAAFDPKPMHTVAMGAFYKDGGKSRDASKLDLSPNPKFFASGTTGNPTTFVPKGGAVTEATRPNGDRKYFSLEDAAAFEVNTYESKWTKGFTGPNNFDGDMFSGVGPFSLEVGESMTVVWAEVGGYRLRGLTDAMAAARYAYEKNYTLPMYPAVPEMKVEIKAPRFPIVRWDNKSTTGPGFAGYKVYRASQAKPVSWLDGGMRILDDYWRLTAPGVVPENLKKSINPNFAAQAFVAGREGVADSWGPYDLVKVIPTADLSKYADNSAVGYNYSYVDMDAPLGFKYWYYIAAYTSSTVTLDASYAGENSPTANSIETSNVNRNGATGLWQNTYPFAYLNAFYPKDEAGKKALGADITVTSLVSNTSDLASGSVKISVKPNPYKKKALFDSKLDAYDHKVMFYNLPATAKITILDVSGQVIQELNFKSTSPTNGTMFWNLFSKDGIEVASGLYVYVVEYDGGKQVGYLSIMR